MELFDELNDFYLYVCGARDFLYEKSGAWVKKVGKHWSRWKYSSVKIMDCPHTNEGQMRPVSHAISGIARGKATCILRIKGGTIHY